MFGHKGSGRPRRPKIESRKYQDNWDEDFRTIRQRDQRRSRRAMKKMRDHWED